MGKKKAVGDGGPLSRQHYWARLTPGVEGQLFAWCDTCRRVVGRPDSWRPAAPEVEALLDAMRGHDAMHAAEQA